LFITGIDIQNEKEERKRSEMKNLFKTPGERGKCLKLRCW
jgi:hypothetical protein